MLQDTLHVTPVILSVGRTILYAFASEGHGSQVRPPMPAINMCHTAMKFCTFDRAFTFGWWRLLRALPALRQRGIQLVFDCMRGRQRSSGEVPVIE